jgi:WD40 repeat protein
VGTFQCTSFSYPIIYCKKDTKVLISASADGTLRVWSADTLQCIQEFIGHEYGVTDFSIFPFSRQLVISTSDDNTIIVWDLMQSQPLFRLSLPQEYGPGKCVSICGDMAALGCYGGTIVVVQCTQGIFV